MIIYIKVKQEKRMLGIDALRNMRQRSTTKVKTVWEKFYILLFSAFNLDCEMLRLIEYFHKIIFKSYNNNYLIYTNIVQEDI